jgi:hypothetical protein
VDSEGKETTNEDKKEREKTEEKTQEFKWFSNMHTSKDSDREKVSLSAALSHSAVRLLQPPI